MRFSLPYGFRDFKTKNQILKVQRNCLSSSSVKTAYAQWALLISHISDGLSSVDLRSNWKSAESESHTVARNF